PAGGRHRRVGDLRLVAVRADRARHAGGRRHRRDPPQHHRRARAGTPEGLTLELGEAVRRRRMVRNFEDRPVPADALGRILDHARRGPSAGHTQGSAFLVLEGPEQVGRFWDCTFPAGRRAGFRWPGLFRAPVVILPCASKDAYLDRYAEPDKGWADRDEARWPVPYWDIDCGMATMAILLT